MAADRAASPVPASAVNALIGRAGLALDDEDFQAFLDLCTTDFRYRIRVESPELDQEMTWLEQTRTELKTMFASLPEHLTRPGRLTRQVCVASTHERRGRIQVTSVFSIFHNRPGRADPDFCGRSLSG